MEFCDMRIEHYQTPEKIVVDIFSAELVAIEISKSELRLNDKVLTLFSEVDESSSDIKRSKLKYTVTLAKKVRGNWPSLEATEITDSKPVYPSSKSKKDWDKLEKEASEEMKKEEEQSSGDVAVNGFFKKLYENATEEQKRAMIKSYTESNGTTLSMDWKDVGSKKVETRPPEGMEAKKYD